MTKRLTYVEAQAAAQALGWTTRAAYHQHYREVPGLPSTPQRAYPEWQDWATFLGTHFLSLEEASQVAREKGWRTEAAYRAHYRTIPGLPSAPDETYQEWRDWATFLGTHFLSLEEASQAAREEGWRNQKSYKANYRTVPGLPRNPEVVYPDFPGWGTFLGTGRTRRTRPDALGLADAQALAQSFTLKSAEEYAARAATDIRLPLRPNILEGWPGWAAFLGVPQPVRLSYAEARAAAQALGVHTARQYHAHYMEHPGLPHSPDVTYAEEWESWKAFLCPPARFLDYYRARRVVRQAGIRSFREYAQVYRNYPGLPSTPNKVYPEWRGWNAFLQQEQVEDEIKDVVGDLAC